jgi:hypothetical protein
MEEAYHKSVSSYVDIAKQATTDLQTLSQHSIELATNLISFCGDKYVVFSAHPVDLMHSFLEGIVKYVVCGILKRHWSLLELMVPLMKCLDQAT